MAERATRLTAGDPALPQALAVIQTAFAYMDGIVDPPSSIHRLRLADLQSADCEVWALGRPVVACVVLTPKPQALYLGKLAVAAEARRKGLAKVLVQVAVARARALGLARVELQTRIELVANHAAFAAMGFVEAGRTAHKGYDRPTSITYHLPARNDHD